MIKLSPLDSVEEGLAGWNSLLVGEEVLPWVSPNLTSGLSDLDPCVSTLEGVL